MLSRNIAIYMVLLIAFSVVPAWALGEPAGEVIDLIEREQTMSVKNDTAEKNERIAAARSAAARKQAEEKAAAEKKENELLAAQKAAAEKKEKEQVAAQKGAEENRMAEAAAVENARIAAAKQEQERLAASQVALARSAAETPARQQSEPAADLRSPKRSWWSAFTDMLGLTDSDPGVTVQPVSSRMAPQTSDYIIGPGDQIGISVWRDENLSRTVVVLPDGRITLPLVGDLIAAGKTVAQLKSETENALSRFTGDSNVTVEVKQSNSMIIFVIGRVNLPGKQMLIANTSVLQALAMAGGPNPFASKSKIRIYRQLEEKTAMFPFDYNEIMSGKHLEMNIELKRGDVIIVP